MTSRPKHYLNCIVLGLALTPWAGCLRPIHAPIPTPVSPPAPKPPEQNKSVALTHLEGVWDSRGANGNHGQLIFSPGGTLSFKEKLEFYNPGKWELDASRKELRLTFPDADYDRLQVFQMAVGDSIKAFDPAKKEITYAFDEETWTLQIAGWTYSKPDGSVDSPARQELNPGQ